MKGQGWRPVLPREHGVWGLVLGPWTVGALIGGGAPAGSTWLLLAGALAVMMAASAELQFLRNAKTRKPILRRWALVYAALGAGLLAPVVAIRPALLGLLPLLAPVFLVGLHFLRVRNERAIANGLLSIVGFSTLTPAAYHVETGAIGSEALLIAWAAVIAFFAGSLFFVRSCFRGRKSLGLRRLCSGYHLALPALALAWSPLLAAAFVPGLIRLVVLRISKPAPALVGTTEIVTLVAHVTLVVLAFA